MHKKKKSALLLFSLFFSTFHPVYASSIEPTRSSSTEILDITNTVVSVSKTSVLLSTSSSVQPKPKPKRVLCLDGGGIRGWFQTLVLLAIQDELSVMAGKNVALEDYVDVVAGTSVGAIVGSALAAKKVTLEGIKHILETEGSQIFSRTLFKRIASLFGVVDEIYDKAYLKKRLKEIHGTDTRFTDLSKDLIVIAHNSTQQESAFFCTFDARQGINNKKVANAVCASASAPVYFEGEEDEDTKDMLIDGGMDANNPTMAAFSILAQYDKGEALNYHYVSIGTGRPNTQRKFNDDLGAIDYVPQLLDLCMDGNSQCTAQMAARAFGDHAVRLNVVLPQKVDMDKADAKNMAKLKKAYDAFIVDEQNKVLIKRAAALLYRDPE